MRSTSRWYGLARWVALTSVLAVVLAACGGGGEATTTTTSAATTTTTAAGDSTTTTEVPSSGPTGTLVVGVPVEHLTLDPQMHRSRITQVISRQVHDNLIYLDPDISAQTFVWWLAESAEQLDDLTWEFKLREDVVFHDGYPFTSESVKYTYDRLFDPAVNSPRATMGTQSLITEVEVVDDYTVRFHTSEPVNVNSQGFPASLGGYSQEMLRPGHYDGITVEQAQSYPTIGTGPFKFVEWVPGQFIRFEANENWWNEGPLVAELVFRTIPEAATRAAELIAGNVDLVYPVDADTMVQLAGQPGIEVQSAPGNAMTMLQMQVSEGRLFADRDLRLGLNYAVDRHLVVENLFRGLGVVETQMSPVAEPDANTTGYDFEWEGFTFDPDLARELLAPIAGQPLELYTPSNMIFVAEVIGEQLRGVGLNVTVIPVDQGTFGTARDNGEYDLWIQTYGGLDNIGNNWASHFTCALRDQGINRTGFCKPELDEMIASVEGLPSAEQRPVYLEVGRALNDDPPWVPLWTLDEIAAYRDYVKGYVQSGIGQMSLYRVWLEE